MNSMYELPHILENHGLNKPENYVNLFLLIILVVLNVRKLPPI